MPFSDLNRRYRHMQRYRQIAEIFIRNGFGYLLEKMDLYHYIPLKNRVHKWQKENEPGQGRRLRRMLEQLGPTFVKFGQVLSVRADLVQKEIRKELEKLQDAVEPVDIEEIRKMIYIETGQRVEDIFADFSVEPLAAASIGQVHRATLITGEDVVVKVQRPGINRKIKVDLEIMENLAQIAQERWQKLPVDPVEMVREFARAFLTELDYRNEGRNAERFRQIFRNRADIVVPEIYWDYTTQRVLTMEYVKGRKIQELKMEECSELAHTAAESFLSQVLVYGFFHGDPHPGNIFITDDGKIVYLDFGLMGELDEQSRDLFARLFLALLRKDTESVVEVFLKLGIVKTNTDSRQFKREISGMIEKYYGIELKDIQIGGLFDEVMDIGRKYHVNFPSDLVLLGRAVVTFEGVVQLLDPSLNTLAVAKPFAIRLVRQRLHPRKMVDSVVKRSGKFLEKAQDLPDDMHKLLQKAINDDFAVKFEHHNLDNVTSKLDIVVNRMVVGMIVSALFVGSSLTIQGQIGPQFRGVSLIGFVGYLMAGVLGMWLVIAILRSGRF